MLLDLLGPPRRCRPHDAAVAGGAVADSFLVIFRFGATLALGPIGANDDAAAAAAAVELPGRRRRQP